MKPKYKQPFILHYDKKAALTASIVISFILAFIMFVSSIYSIILDDSKDIKLLELISIESVSTLLLNTLLIYFLFRLQFWAIRKFSDNKRKMWMVLVILFFMVAFTSPLFANYQKWWFKDIVSSNVYSTIHYVKDLTVLIISFLFTALIHLINENQKNVTENQKNITENQKLVIENLKNKYTALKNQTDPHFLFNSLNTLNGLIGYDNDRAHEYVEQLSEVFRYTMKDKSIVKVADELQFVESYLYLMAIRYNDGLNIHLQNMENYKEFYILPFGLQLLIENAVKHNIISKKAPLTITIRPTGNNTIRVENNIQTKHQEKLNTSLGLTNLNERCQLICGKEIEIFSDNNFFAVEVPIIKDIKNLKYI